MSTVTVPMKKSIIDSTVVYRCLGLNCRTCRRVNLFGVPASSTAGNFRWCSHAIDPKALKEYWDHVECFTDWGFCHPVCQANSEVRGAWPLFVYGDDVKFSQAEKLTVVMAGLVLDETKSSLHTHHPLFIIREARLRPNSNHYSTQCLYIYIYEISWFSPTPNSNRMQNRF